MKVGPAIGSPYNFKERMTALCIGPMLFLNRKELLKVHWLPRPAVYMTSPNPF